MRAARIVERSKTLGHENLGEVTEVGKAVDAIKKGEKVVPPFNIGCGFCANCERGLSGYCLTCAALSVMPGMAGAAWIRQHDFWAACPAARAAPTRPATRVQMERDESAPAPESSPAEAPATRLPRRMKRATMSPPLVLFVTNIC